MSSEDKINTSSKDYNKGANSKKGAQGTTRNVSIRKLVLESGTNNNN